MSHHKPHGRHGNRVDWNDPHLQSLLSRTEHWKLDNRSSHAPQDVQVHIGWGASTGRPGVLVYERDQVMVLETTFPIQQGEHVRVDRIAADGLRVVWGMVVESREGQRAEDRLHGVHVHWLHVR
ncbi:hypothetical protein [Fulvimonas soli]|jgi:hypothetical protein|uniref:PilZ domain-containing protein n=1 Tax=Fulvimonas soli TaxID=155197 RepID=A0A316I326_9GAMM|nr:hypothetical protein [Fulvimonas soli]PWK87779.1 hypothetical protein C7456_106272 [Fulvimonas soli]TNY26509.1 hypothetical protein BV497_08175 [Fulvimonas soli]